MVFAGSGEEESMAMGPERSKPLHNFMLPCSLKWGSQRYLRCMKVAPDAGDRRSPPSTRKRELEPPPNNARDSDKRTRITKPRIHGDDGIDAVREKLMLDLKTEADRMKDAILGKEVAEENDDDDEGEEEEGEAAAAAAVTVAVAETEERVDAAPAAGVRPWNLRTRRAACKAPAAGGDSGKGLKIEERRPNSSPSGTVNGAVKLRGSPEKTEKVNFSLPLSRKEIEEDFMQLVGHRPPRRPKKRPRNVQRQMDVSRSP